MLAASDYGASCSSTGWGVLMVFFLANKSCHTKADPRHSTAHTAERQACSTKWNILAASMVWKVGYLVVFWVWSQKLLGPKGSVCSSDRSSHLVQVVDADTTKDWHGGALTWGVSVTKYHQMRNCAKQCGRSMRIRWPSHV